MATALAGAALLGGGAVAYADSPHFISASDSVNSSGSLVASFKEAGLGTTVSTETIKLTADGTATYACINGGGNHPKATNKETVSGRSQVPVPSQCATARPRAASQLDRRVRVV